MSLTHQDFNELEKPNLAPCRAKKIQSSQNLNIIQVRNTRNILFKAKENAVQAAQSVSTVVPYKPSKLLPQKTLEEFDLKSSEIESSDHKVDFVKTNAIMQGFAAKTLSKRYEVVKTIDEQKNRQKKLININRWTRFKVNKQKAIDNYITARKNQIRAHSLN